MGRVDILHTICCIEQQLLLEDHSPSIHDTDTKYPSVMYSPFKENVELSLFAHVGATSTEDAQFQ